MGIPHVRIELRGTLCSGAEVWSAGFSTAPPVSGPADVTTLAALADNLFNARFGTNANRSMWAASVAYTGTRAQELDATGHVTGSAEYVRSSPTTGSADNSCPPQSAIVVSLRTPYAGPRFRGRMYLPAPATTVLTSVGRLQAARRDDVVVMMGQFFNDWNSATATMPVGVATNVGNAVTSVTRVQVGDVIDTQRRRRDALPESYNGTTVTP